MRDLQIENNYAPALLLKAGHAPEVETSKRKLELSVALSSFVLQ